MMPPRPVSSPSNLLEMPIATFAGALNEQFSTYFGFGPGPRVRNSLSITFRHACIYLCLIVRVGLLADLALFSRIIARASSQTDQQSQRKKGSHNCPICARS
jgi:hypothetical protein